MTPQMGRFISAERDLGIPVRFAYVLLVYYYLFFGFSDLAAIPDNQFYTNFYRATIELPKKLFLIYGGINLVYLGILLNITRVHSRVMLYCTFAMALLDGLMFCCLIVIEDGFNSPFFWVYFGMVLRNAYAISDAFFQITLNFSIVIMYAIGGIFGRSILKYDEMRESWLSTDNSITDEQVLLRMVLLVAIVIFCFGFQVLLDRERRLREEQQELSIRNEHLKGIGRLAAEIAHQLKNPISIINNAAFILQRNQDNMELVKNQASIIREEITRSDNILKNLLMDATQSVASVRKLNIRHEIEEAIRVALPDGVFPGVRVEYLTPVPADLHLLIQPRHLSEILVNLLVNAREAMQSDGTIRISAGRNSETSIFISISDTGPGVPPEHQNRIFEAFFSTKEQGTGIGLGIVKKYVELYSGRITLDSSPRGSSFTLVFPEKLSIAPTK